MCTDSGGGEILIEKGEMGVEGRQEPLCLPGLFFFFFKARTTVRFVVRQGSLELRS